MKRTLFLMVAFFVRVHACTEVPYLANEFDPAKWPEANLRLSQAGTLKDVFDSNLRPYRYPRLENKLLAAKHIQLRIQLSSGKVFPQFSAEKIQITPFADGEISTIEGFTPKLTLAQSREEMKKWLSYGMRTEADLDIYLKAVEADFLDFDDPYRGRPDGCAIRWKEPGWGTRGGGPQCTVWLKKAASPSTPLRLRFKISWGSNRPPKDAQYYRVPIPPPPGYEHVDMTAPKNFGPDSMVDILRSKGVDIGDGKGGVPQEECLARQSEADQRPDGRRNPGPSKGEQSKKTTGWWIVAGILALLVLLALTWHKYRPQTEG